MLDNPNILTILGTLLIVVLAGISLNLWIKLRAGYGGRETIHLKHMLKLSNQLTEAMSETVSVKEDHIATIKKFAQYVTETSPLELLKEIQAVIGVEEVDEIEVEEISIDLLNRLARTIEKLEKI